LGGCGAVGAAGRERGVGAGQFLNIVRKETPMWGKVIKDAGIKMPQ
jgi:hypothetical protein